MRFSLHGRADQRVYKGAWWYATGVIRHATNRVDQERDFVDSIWKFVEDWKAGLEAHW
jgi:hypothetical protein